MNKKYPYLFIGLIVGLFFAWIFWKGVFSGPENFFKDMLFSSQSVHKDLVVLAVDNQSLQKIGQWPWPRKVFSEAIDKLNAASPKVIAFDILFAEPSRFGDEDDNFLKTSLESTNFPVVLPVEANNLFLSKDDLPVADFFIEPLVQFSSTQRVSLGEVNIIIDRDGIVRRFPLEIRSRQSGNMYKSLAYKAVVQSGLDIPKADTLDLVNNIAYANGANTIRTIPFWRILEDSNQDLLKDKIVFLGVTAPDLHDTQLTPFNKNIEMSGVEIQANIANMLLKGYRITPIAKGYIAIWIILSALLPILFFVFFKRLRFALFFSLLFGFGHLVLVVLLWQYGMSANIIHITLSWLFSVILLFAYRHFIGEKEKRQLRDVFSKYVSKEVVKEILEDPSKVSLGGEEKEVTVLFSDIRSFTSLSEKTQPVELVTLLNRYFTVMTEEILKKKGVLDKYIGDAIMAFWGAPINNPKQADFALEASIAMLERLDKLNIELEKEDKDKINIGIGLYTGPVVVGNMGSEQRLNYTVMGDTVNVAARLESLNKQYKTRIIVGERTKNQITKKYNWQSLGSVQVKGRTEPINIYTIENLN